MKVLVTGGAGYIGSVTVEALRKNGDEVIILDNLSTGHKESIDPSIKHYNICLKNLSDVLNVFNEFKPDAVIHFAASSLVGESVQDPAKYMDNNVIGTLNLLRAMKESGTRHLVFSSTAATYGEPQSIPLTETHPTNPTNPYGLTKRFMEQAMETYANAYDFEFVALRYFNACGAIPTRGEDHKPESHLIPLVLQVALGQREHIAIFGNDYDTPDGTCVRDYIHISDLANAHLRAVDYLQKGNSSLICNLGNGQGFSVKEVIETCRKVTGHEIETLEQDRREGDPSRLIADATLAKEKLGWVPEKTNLEEIIQGAWEWHQKHPNGYSD